MIELTEQQRQSVKNGEAIRIPAPEIGEDVVLVRAAQYDSTKDTEAVTETAPQSPKQGQRLLESFLRGMGSVLEFFPPPERLDAWRLGQDIGINKGQHD